MQKILFLLIFLVAFGIFEMNESFGLSCEESTWDEEFDRSDVVFTAKVISKEYLPFDDGKPYEKIAISTLKVEEVFKGALDDTVKISSDEGFWGIYLSANWRYVIFGNYSKDFVNVPLCSKSGSLPPLPDSEKIEWKQIPENNLKQLKELLLDRGILFVDFRYEESLSTNDQVIILSPLKQIKNGVELHDVICKEGLELIFKLSNNSPVCVSLKAKVKLIERGFGN